MAKKAAEDVAAYARTLASHRRREAEREKRAKIIHAAGEFEASAKLSQAAT